MHLRNSGCIGMRKAHFHIKSIIRNKCKCKDVTLNTSLLVEKRSSFAASWNASLHHQMGSLPDFNEAFTRTIESLEYYLL